jgi:hypothetical protein
MSEKKMIDALRYSNIESEKKKFFTLFLEGLQGFIFLGFIFL